MTEHDPRGRPTATGAGALTAHVEECDQCSMAAPPVERIGTLLDATRVDIDPAVLSLRALMRLKPELQGLATASVWWRVAAGVLLALLPLPAVLAYDAYVLRRVYEIFATLLPTSVAAYLVLSYAASLVLLFALTYAAIPVLVVRGAQHRTWVET